MSGMELQKKEVAKMGRKAAGAGVLSLAGFLTIPILGWTVFGTIIGVVGLVFCAILTKKWFNKRAEWGMRF